MHTSSPNGPTRATACATFSGRSPPAVGSSLLGNPDIPGVAVTDTETKPHTAVFAAYFVADNTLETDALPAFAAERLARYKQPRLYARVASLPRNANNKLLRRALPGQTVL